MTCEEFVMAGLDLGATAGDAREDAKLEAAAREHLKECAHCAALQDNWSTLRSDLHALGQELGEAEAAPRVEMRLRQEFRRSHAVLKTRRTGLLPHGYWPPPRC